MLLEVENQLHRRVHSAIGQSAVVLRLAEEIDQSGRVAEQTMVVISYTGENSSNPVGGAYVPTVRKRSLNYSITIIQKQTQREGHSFALPVMDLIYDAVTGWVPEIPGLQFHTGFEPGAGRFVQITEASQFIYEMTFAVDVILADGRFYSQPCAAFDPISLEDFLPVRSCLLTEDRRRIGLAVWRRRLSPTSTEEYIVEDSRCAAHVGDSLKTTCESALNGNASYVFTPRIAIGTNKQGERVVDETRVTRGSLRRVWKCYKDNDGRDYPPWFDLNIESGIWRNAVDTVPNTDPETSALQLFTVEMKRKYNG